MTDLAVHKQDSTDKSKPAADQNTLPNVDRVALLKSDLLPSPTHLNPAESQHLDLPNPFPSKQNASTRPKQPGLAPESPALKPKDPVPDSHNQSDRVFNPIAPLGTIEGDLKKQIKEPIDGVASRKPLSSVDGTLKTFEGFLQDSFIDHTFKPDGSGLNFNVGETHFYTLDNLQNGKLQTRQTVYDRPIDMNFDQGEEKPPLNVDQVSVVYSRFQEQTGQYTTSVPTDDHLYVFTSDNEGKVTGVKDLYANRR